MCIPSSNTSPWYQTLQYGSSDEEERITNHPPATTATTGGWVEEDDITRSDSLTVLIESDPIAAAAVMNNAPTDAVRAQQEQLEVHPVTLESVHSSHHGNTISTADTNPTNSDDTQKLL